jgi:L-histidine Nalpha-methyltransferase
MQTALDTGLLYLDLSSGIDDSLDEVIAGLSAEPRVLPSKLLYDDRGSELFDQITELDEYYPTRTEKGLLENILGELEDILPEQLTLVEYGSGNSEKTHALLSGLPSISYYIPIDISREHLLNASERIRSKYPELVVLPVCADYSTEIHLGLNDVDSKHLAVFFPGSTIGNFERQGAITFLSHIRTMLGTGGHLMIGVDLKKDLDILLPAYNDALGITAEFNRNILSHINKRFGSNFEPDKFSHESVYNELDGRIEMYLTADQEMRVHLADNIFSFDAGDRICTEYSHKYSESDFEALADLAGFDVEQVWTDDEQLFSFQLLVAR